MGVKLKLLKRGEDRMTYSLPSLGFLSEKLVDTIEWPADKPILAFRFSPKRVPQGQPIRDMISRRKYICRTTYNGNKRDIPPAISDGGEFGLKLAPFGSMKAYKRTVIRTIDRYFLKPFRDYQEGNYKEDHRTYFKKCFPTTKGISVRKAGKVVGMVSVMHMPKDGRPYRPCSWISWLWVDAALPKDERKVVHGMLGGWIKKLPGKYFGGAIHAVNLKSQNWFIKMGASPVQVFFLRR